MVCFRRFGSTVTYEVCTLFWKEEKRKKETRLDAATLVPSAHRVSPGLFTPRFFLVQTYRTMVANFDRSSKWAASTAETMAPSNAERSHNSSVTRNFRARLKKAVGPFEALTAITCRGLSSSPGVD